MTKCTLILMVISLSITLNSCSKNDPNEESLSGTFTDSRDGKAYETIEIGNQIWMAENMAYLPAVSPVTDGSLDEPIYYVYGYSGNVVNDAKASANYSAYGVLYNWEAALQACPAGWHIPSDQEWMELETYLGMNPDFLDETGNRGIDEGDKLKATTGWPGNGNGNNESGFNALPAGARSYEGHWEVGGEWAEFWSSTSDEPDYNWNRYLIYNNSKIGRWRFQKSYGLSVRCVKDY